MRKRIMEIREAVVGAVKNAVWAAAYWAKPQEVENRMMQTVHAASVTGTMEYLNKMNLIHCVVCPERFGLQKVLPNMYACRIHLAAVKAASAPRKEGIK